MFLPPRSIPTPSAIPRTKSNQSFSSLICKMSSLPTASSRVLKVTPPSPGVQPEYYLSKPHHSSTGFQFPKAWGKSHRDNNFFEFFKARLFDWDEPALPKVEDRPKVRKPSYRRDSSQGDEHKIRYTSLGHASCHLQIPVPVASSTPRKYETITILTDPVFSKRCSPFQFMGPARYTEAPTSIADMASIEEDSQVKVWPDIVAISHNHYDHLDYNTIYDLVHPPAGKQVPHFVVTLGVAQWFKHFFKLPDSNLSELDWWDSIQVTSSSSSSSSDDQSSKIKITCTPAQHFSGRGLTDRNKSLFAGYAFETIPPQSSSADEKVAKIWFTGDSGFGYVPKGTKKEEEDSLPKTPIFKEIGETLGPFDLCLIPIGAYSPRGFMSTIHMDPSDAVQVHQLVKSKQSYGIHFSVFRLTPEDINEPQKLLLEETKRRGVREEDFSTVAIGETVGVEIGK